MKFSNSWLREWVDPQLTPQELADQITMAGLEVDSVEAVAGEFTGVVVGEIVACERHPDADKLRVCTVAGHPDGEMQVVCGAPNARAGIKVPFALVGAKLPGDFKIKKAKLRGVESFGMLCAQTELELGEDGDGIWELPEDAPTGKDLREYLQLDDVAIEVDLTPNRSDCLGIAGIAREVGVLNRCPVKGPEIAPVAAQIDDSVPVSLLAGDACPRYVGRVIRNIDITAPTPLWMQERLRRSGLRSIDPVVDVTNYVLLELGQPMHAFDLSKLSGGIKVRMAEKGEELTLLDGQEVKLEEGTLLIADEEKPLAIAGVMGGLESSVTEGTRDIFLESAFFNPLAVAGKARSYGLHTDSSHRFERGVDYRLQERAVERATQLLLEIVGGEPGPVHLRELSEAMPTERHITLRRRSVSQRLGVTLADDEIVDILTRLGLEKIDENAESWTFLAPSFRFDIAIEADLLEELARVYGYNRIPSISLTAALDIEPRPERALSRDILEQTLLARGYSEAVTFSFIDREIAELFDPDTQPVALQNPISADLAVMRTSLIPGLCKALQYNLNRQQNRVRLFESGLRFVPGSELRQEPMLAGLAYGARFAENWTGSKDDVDFYDIKADVEALLAHYAIGESAEKEFRFAAGQHPALHPGQCARIYRGDREVGVVGALHPQLQKKLDLPRSALVFELNLEALGEAVLPSFRPLSRFPEVRRDLALLIDADVPAANLVQSALEAAGETLTDLKIFDVYQGKGIDFNRKSVALGLTFQHPSRTLNDEEINTAVDAVVGTLKQKYNASLR
ncbi:phenylalanine--tRNA ligase subunit beta [Microbulbifer thermotolerans]|uniref:phenylalanine--tRNA ligase subunit beta n=1 Tax=Microbulbifer thermotolerans TaxID=252514 RepID=UPI00224B559B|nr:phenylalanine--tRNA ligase subunit beta [Microbulbifer thermotolerans]MCX2781811.1 phenylalanine--tRNA ligase subunit beta [Microbulbifer thermotolerans]MCX2834432.1 phenylalanine--tRNA ligase subunit beta [Microbulbifer thermotolerans]